jgi:hypothetical protein
VFWKTLQKFGNVRANKNVDRTNLAIDIDLELNIGIFDGFEWRMNKCFINIQDHRLSSLIFVPLGPNKEFLIFIVFHLRLNMLLVHWHLWSTLSLGDLANQLTKLLFLGGLLAGSCLSPWLSTFGTFFSVTWLVRLHRFFWNWTLIQVSLIFFCRWKCSSKWNFLGSTHTFALIVVAMHATSSHTFVTLVNHTAGFVAVAQLASLSSVKVMCWGAVSISLVQNTRILRFRVAGNVHYLFW